MVSLGAQYDAVHVPGNDLRHARKLAPTRTVVVLLLLVLLDVVEDVLVMDAVDEVLLTVVVTCVMKPVVVPPG